MAVRTKKKQIGGVLCVATVGMTPTTSLVCLPKTTPTVAEMTVQAIHRQTGTVLATATRRSIRGMTPLVVTFKQTGGLSPDKDSPPPYFYGLHFNKNYVSYRLDIIFNFFCS